MTMRKQLLDAHGQPIVLGKELGKGGEGSVFEIQNHPKLAAKVYFKELDQTKSNKIISMTEHANEKLLALSAWPISPIFSEKSKLMGFTMSKLTGHRPIYELYSPKLRLQEFPKADWRFLIHAAINTARAFSTMHALGHVVGDVNHGNIFVASDATMRFIDTDSFQIYLKNQYWHCEVGVSTHQPAEMQGLLSYKAIIRTPNQDCFGLAVLIFQLLFLARHPFSGRFAGKEDMPIEKAISEFRFAYAANTTSTQMSPPPASLPITSLTPTLQNYFHRAFAKESVGAAVGLRPTADDWIAALQELSQNLKKCSSNASHYYLSSLSECPWCDIEAKSGTLLFPISFTTDNPLIDIPALWKKILAANDTGDLFSLPNPSQYYFKPSFEAQQIKEKLNTLTKQSLVIFAIISLATCWLGFVFLLFLPLIICLFRFCYTFLKQALTKSIREEYETAKANWQHLETFWKQLAQKDAILKTRKHLTTLKSQYDSLNTIKQQKLKNLSQTYKQKILNKHLIASADISGIGSGRKATLQSYGIETAADIERSRLKVIPGFGSVLITRLLNWRAECEKSIPANLNHAPTQADISVIDQEIVALRRKQELELSQGYQQLTLLNKQLLEIKTQVKPQAEEAASYLAQCLANADLLALKL